MALDHTEPSFQEAIALHCHLFLESPERGRDGSAPACLAFCLAISTHCPDLFASLSRTIHAQYSKSLLDLSKIYLGSVLGEIISFYCSIFGDIDKTLKIVCLLVCLLSFMSLGSRPLGHYIWFSGGKQC